ncbi:MAG TPA: copper amine oxidase N-terminal domain-containing protein [Clostridia bacterium]|nr:copper amine oxidase N-terminal domain-containing protein [Clostridia bacterium]
MKKLMSLVLILIILTTVTNYADTTTTVSETTMDATESVMAFTEKENTILKGTFEKYENNTLYIQSENNDHLTSLYDADGLFKNLENTYEANEEIILYAEYGEATFQLLDILPKATQEIYGQIKSINEETFDILSGDVVETYEVFNSHRGFVNSQFVKGYVSDKGTYLMPTIDTSNQKYDTFGKLIEKNIVINGESLKRNSTVVNGNLMIPLRETLESLGYEIKWNNDTRRVDIHKSNQWTSVKINENRYFKNKMAHQPLSHAPIIIDGSTYIPVEFLNVILDLGLSVTEGNLTVSENDMAIHSGHIQTIDYKAAGKISITLSSKEMPGNLSDLTIIHASTDTTYFNTSLKQGQFIHVISPPVMTMSLPGQTSAVVIY